MRKVNAMICGSARLRHRLALVCASAFLWHATDAVAAPTDDSLKAGFVDPPNVAQPRVWWHWINGNVSAEGAKLDIEWMQRVGIGGFHAFSGGQRQEPVVVPQRLPFMSEGWRDVLRRSVDQGHAAGMEVGIAGSPGWSETGGTWVVPKDGMKKYVWSETRVEGGHPFTGKLLPPPAVTGMFQGFEDKAAKGAAYGDAAVIAFPTPAMEQTLPVPKVTTSTGAVDLSAVVGDTLPDDPIKLALPAGSTEISIEAAYPKPVTIGAISFAIVSGAAVRIEAADAHGAFHAVAEGQVYPAAGNVDPAAPQQTLAFVPVTAQRFRLVLSAPHVPARGILAMAGNKAFTLVLRQLHFISGARINGYEVKAGFEASINPSFRGSPAAPKTGVIDPKRVVNLTDRLHPDGSLEWTPPSGRWTILRFGWSLTGAHNAPAEPDSTGLEVDKFDPAAVQRYIDTYLDQYQQATGGKLGPQGIQTLLTDSWEAGAQNWTPAMPSEFRTRRGYDLLPYLPVLTGRVVESADVSERFLFDFRTTLKEMIADNHYGVLERTMKARGMSYYTEAEGDSPRAIVDGLTVKARSDIPTAEYWYRPFATAPGQPPLKADLEEAASAAHVYGKPFAAAESLTVGAFLDPWSFSPNMLKPVADEIFARGINRIIYHESHHQPLVDAKPGLTLGIFGQYFNRNETWAEYAGPWVSYLARTSYMLQQGRFVADVAYFYGEEQNLTEIFRDKYDTGIPNGYGYDFINPEALLTLLDVRDGRLVTPSGMSYRILYIPETVQHMSLPALRKIRDLVARGAVLVGNKPVGGLGVMSPEDDVHRLANEVWGNGGATEGRKVGQGRVYTTLKAALAGEQIAADVAFEGQTANADLLTLHRHADDFDIYFVSNQTHERQSVRAHFRVADRMPELWRAETGNAEDLSYEKVAGGIVTPLTLAPGEAVFVVLRRAATAQAWTVPAVETTPLMSVGGPWHLAFQANRGAPATATFDRLMSWPESSDAGIKYFSGAATYSVEVNAPRAWFKAGRRIELDLGDVRELAAVSVNGVRVATAWHAPYAVDMTHALKPGKNRVQIDVVNLWPNRLIGDKQPGAKAITFAPTSPYKADSPLLPSGLLGPVQIVAKDEASTGSAHSH